MSGHTKEPWGAAIITPSPSQPGSEPYALWVSGAGPRAVQVERSTCIAADDMIRIVACVNACAGMDDPEKFIKDLESGSKMHFDQAMKNGEQAGIYKAQRDELLAALKDSQWWIPAYQAEGAVERHKLNAELIAKVERL